MELAYPETEPRVDYFTPLENALRTYLNDEQLAKIKQAYITARDAHEGQTRKSGDPYITHPVAAAEILADMRMDHQSIMATLLHDVIEDTAVSKSELAAQFGDEVAELVDGVSKLTQIEFSSRAEAQAENFRKMVLAMVRDIRVILVKLADRLHNMRTLGVMPPEKKRRIAIETLEIYAPIANRLGMHNLYVELEDLGFQALYPLRYRILQKAVKKARGDRQEILNTIEENLAAGLSDFRVKPQTMFGRRKHLYSIYKKMRAKRSTFSEIMDVYGVRVIVKDIPACYQVLGAVHNVYKPLSERFKDYIAIPKANGYQSIHSTLFGPYGVPIEVQIRTEEMDHVAENGIAAHWLYKSHGMDADEAQLRAREWIKGLLEMQQSAGDSLEFIENVKIDLFPDEVYVFTPGGDIMELPRGATPVDFAYMVHSDIGNSCVAARVNRRLAPLSSPLINGQTVEIVTAPGAFPNPAWLNFVVTGKARSNIRHFLKTQRRSEAIKLGRQLLESDLLQLGANLEKISAAKIEHVLQECHYDDLDDLCEAIGQGNQIAMLVAQRLIDHVGEDHSETKGEQGGLAIKGTEGMVVRYAECCHPIPGDDIVGVINPGKGIVVHVDQCREVVPYHRSQSDRLVTMCWASEVEGDFIVDVLIEVTNQRGVLAQLASAVADAEANIDNITVDPRDGRHNMVVLTLGVRDRVHLARVMRRLKMLKVVSRINRAKVN